MTKHRTRSAARLRARGALKDLQTRMTQVQFCRVLINSQRRRLDKRQVDPNGEDYRMLSAVMCALCSLESKLTAEWHLARAWQRDQLVTKLRATLGSK